MHRELVFVESTMRDFFQIKKYYVFPFFQVFLKDFIVGL